MQDEIMRKRILIAVVVIIAIALGGYSVWAYLDYLDYLDKTVHETDRWAVIKDSKGDIIAVETTNDEVWNTLLALRQNQTQMWIGGVIETYDNKWGFRFNKDSIIVAQFTIEGAQSNIQGISDEFRKRLYFLSHLS
jgi:hypothetical protein